ncbi:ribosome recycling factor [Candidatus Uhrbacteria bacterium]|nr:ribosome recycling factor [Candidatus Uhrbacteria bacterium]
MHIIDEAKPNFAKAIDHLAENLMAIRTGRANPGMVENVEVEAYGTMQPLKALAAISTPDARTISIDPWDAGVTKAIETSLQKADLGMNPTVDGKTIRMVMPMMTDETRQRMVKMLKEKLEEARVAVRRVREEVKKKVEKEEGVGKDDIRRNVESLEKVVKEYMAQIDAMGEKKEKEITTI